MNPNPCEFYQFILNSRSTNTPLPNNNYTCETVIDVFKQLKKN